MNSIITFSLKNKLAIWLLTIIITVAGLYSGMNMKLETLPSISTPVISISSVYPGAAPADVAEKISEPIEKRISNLSGVDAVSSSSMANVSSIQMEYNYDKDMDKAVDEVKEAISSLEFPEGAQEPKVSRIDLNAFPVAALSVTNKNADLPQLTKQVEENLVPKLEGLEGASSVTISGQQVEEAVLTYDKKKMDQYGLDEQTVKGIVQGSNVSLPLGLFNFKDEEKTIVVDGNITTLDDLKNVEIPVVPAAQGQAPAQAPQGMQGQGPPGAPQGPAGSNAGGQGIPQGPMTQGSQGQGAAPGQTQAPEMQKVKLSDIADVKIIGKAESISRTNGQESIGIQVTKSPEANTVDVVNAVKDEIKQFEKEYDGAEIHTTLDQGKPIEDSVETMLSKAIIGGLFAVLIILLFLRNIRSTIISIISIPLSLLIAILVLKQMDISLNIMTLGAMTVAIGRVIDDSIVVVENIFRRMALPNEKLTGKELIRAATKEMFVPIFSSTIVTIAVFLPLGLVKGPVGELFLPFALTIVFALLASLLVAVTIVPSLAHSLFKKGLKGKAHEERQSRLSGFYRNVLNWSLNHKLVTFGLAIVLLAASLFLVPVIGVSFLPSEEEKTMIITYKPAPGEKQEDVEAATEQSEKYFMDRKNVDSVQYTVGGENPMGMGPDNSALFYVMYDPDTNNFDKEKDKVLKDLQEFSTKGEWKSQDFTGTGASNELSLNVYGENIEQIQPIVDKTMNILKDQKELKDVDSSISESYDQYTLVADQDKLSDLGITAGQIGMALSNTGERETLTTIKKEGKDVNVYIEAQADQYEDKKDLENKTITSPFGTEIPLKDVVKIEEGKSSDTITRRDGKVYASVSAKIKTDDVSKVTDDVKKEVDDIDLPGNASISFGGVSEQINESFSQLGLAMLAAIAIVYLILVMTFHGGLAPIAILFSLPFTIIGGLLGLFIAGETLSVSALIGALMLIGIVVTNAIVLIDRVIKKEEEGISTREALLEAGATRLRPILMTAIATVGALIPLAIGAEGGGLVSKGLGVTVIGGLTSSTLLTLVIVPVVYEFITKFRKKKQAETK
ncbi:efflux RND transporter permease subunit [Peribacillus cavernae]|uniref:Efflux RND transporter permease subunit n=1 Tax=Peribacillus cavernae TaxID=1674310 RepID=A0A3S0UAJ3_9BACI|nr:efflux RND transporter permease subunit [Peribacillus cavernae]MDQ0221288.1 HAE1 family hydrophobic/amphiphilic exporter-1 [Peribacillus cavernae]RUQ26990.1 efflux RND transporter permease subunit [Peribacillus cavernae]